MDDPTTKARTAAERAGPRPADPAASDSEAQVVAGSVSLASVLHDLDEAGHTGQFAARDGARLLCLTCRHEFPAEEQRADHVRRLEGASDPADMIMVVPLQCPHCGATGALTAHYGPEASAEEADVLAALDRTPSEG